MESRAALGAGEILKPLASEANTHKLIFSRQIARMKQERLIKPPRISSRAKIVLISLSLALAFVTAWLSVRHDTVFWSVAFFFFTLIAIRIITLRRSCPECAGRLTPRWENVSGTRGGHRAFLDCPRCQIAWTDGVIHFDD
jgi:hypothetical protein